MGQLVGGVSRFEAQCGGVWHFWGYVGWEGAMGWDRRCLGPVGACGDFSGVWLGVWRGAVSQTSPRVDSLFDSVVFGNGLVLDYAAVVGVCSGFLLLACLAIDAVSVGLCEREIQSEQKENAHGFRAVWLDGLGGDGVFVAI